MRSHDQTEALPTSVRQVFDAAFTRALSRELVEHAQRQCAQFRRNAVLHLAAQDLVQTAIVKTLEGTLQWDPTRRTLAHHLKAAIDSQVSHELRHAHAFPTVRLDAHDGWDALDAAITRASAQAHGSERAATEALGEALDALHVAARGDVAVRTLLDAYKAGARTRREVTTFTGMSRREYAAAYARLVRLAQRSDLASDRAA